MTVLTTITLWVMASHVRPAEKEWSDPSTSKGCTKARQWHQVACFPQCLTTPSLVVV